MKAVLMIASNFGLNALNALLDSNDIKVAGIITTTENFQVKQKDLNKVNDYFNPIYNELKKINLDLKLPLFIFNDKSNYSQMIRELQNWHPDILLVVGWYHMLPQSVLEIPLKGTWGLHASLLPKYRGGAPLVWAIINGEEKTGISLFQLQGGVDDGMLLGQRQVNIHFSDTIREVYSNVETQGINLLKDKIPGYLRGDIIPYSQPVIQGYEYKPWPLRDQQDGKIDWNQNPLHIYNFVRAQTKPYPGAFSFIKKRKVIIWKCSIFPFMPETSYDCGTIIKTESGGVPMDGFLVACQKADYSILVQQVQYNGRDYEAFDFIKQFNIHVGDYFE